MNNLHVVMNPFRFASRILKETASLVRSGRVDYVYIAAFHEKGLAGFERIDDAREVWRARLRSRELPRVFFAQVFKYLEYCAKVFLHARGKGIGLVNVHTVDLLPLGVFLKKVFKAKLVYDPHELETEKYGLRGIHQSVARFVERTFIRSADLVVVVGGGIEKWYRDRYGLRNVATVMNCPGYVDLRKGRLLREELGIGEGKKIVIYQGGLVRGRGVERLLEIFAEHDDDRHVLVLMGYGELEPLVREHAASRPNIRLKEAVEPGMVLPYTCSADVGVTYIDNGSLNDRLCLPNKMFEYIMAGLPVIVNDAPEMRRVVEEYRIGVVLESLTGESLARALDEIDRLDRGVLAENLKRAASVFSWENQEKVMLGAYREHVWGASGGNGQ